MMFQTSEAHFKLQQNVCSAGGVQSYHDLPRFFRSTIVGEDQMEDEEIVKASIAEVGWKERRIWPSRSHFFGDYPKVLVSVVGKKVSEGSSLQQVQ